MDYLLTFFFLVAAHYFEWSNFLPSWKMSPAIRIVINYGIGTIGMLAPFIAWLYERGEVDVIWKLVSFVVVAGAAPMLCYVNDAFKNKSQRANEAEEREHLLIEQRDAAK